MHPPQGQVFDLPNADTRDQVQMLLCRGSGWHVCFLLSVSLLQSGSELQLVNRVKTEQSARSMSKGHE